MKKKQACLMLAALVSICCLICLIATVSGVVAAIQTGGSIPTGMIFLSCITILCVVMIWKGVREMEE